MREFEIFYKDLTEKAQKELCKVWDTTPEDENWDVFPLAFLEREDLEDELEGSLYGLSINDCPESLEDCKYTTSDGVCPITGKSDCHYK